MDNITQINNLIKNKCYVEDKLGQGSFSSVFIGKYKNNIPVAIKIDENTMKKRLLYEYKIYTRLRELQGVSIPLIYEFIEGEKTKICPIRYLMIMELLDHSLENIFDKNQKKLPLGFIIKLSINIIDILENIHKLSIVHRDIKPANFMFKNNILYLVDFGLSCCYRNRKGEHIPLNYNKSLIGTLRYTSINIHLGIEPSRRDDLESVSYMLLYLILGRLPWQGNKCRDTKKLTKIVGDIKYMTNFEKLCHNIPKCFYDFVAYCKNLKFEEEPDYFYIKSLFIKYADDNNIELSYNL